MGGSHVTTADLLKLCQLGISQPHPDGDPLAKPVHKWNTSLCMPLGCAVYIFCMDCPMQEEYRNRTSVYMLTCEVAEYRVSEHVTLV